MNNDPPCKEHDHTSERRDNTFTAFRNNTDEKNQTIKITKTFLDDYLPPLIHNLTITVQDWGVGDGDLSGKIAVLMKSYSNDIVYEGIDRSMQFVNSTTSNLFTLGFRNNTITLGSIFGGEIDNLSKNPTLLIASQVLYYAKDINNFVEMITKKMGFVAIIIGQATGSFLDHVGMEYDKTTGKFTEGEEKIDEAVKKQTNFNSLKIIYNSGINFPKNISFEELRNISLGNYSELTGQRAHIRNLLEFTGGSMERLICEESLENFLKDFQTQLSISGGNINFWNFISIIVPASKGSVEELTLKLRNIEKLLLSGNITSFESAIKEGNYEIIMTLFNQGLVTCSLHDYKYSLQKDITEKLLSLFFYELRLSFGYQSFAKFFFDYELDERVEYRSYYHPAIHRIQNIKYNFKLPNETTDKLNKEPNGVIADGQKYSESNSFKNKWLHNEFICSALLIIPPILIGDTVTTTQISLSMILMYYNIYEKFIFTSSNAINKMDGGTLLFQLFLFEKHKLDSLKFQNSMGQTPLHLAILTNDTDKAFKLLCCNSTLVNDLINIKDIYGKLPIHYAAEHNNINIAEIILKNETTVNQESYNHLRSFFDLLFLSGKLGYLYAYFTGWVQTNQIHPAMVLWPSYYILKMNDINFPENIYFHSVLLRLDPFGQEESYLNRTSESYHGYSRDNFLHLAAKNNYTDFIKLFINKSNININTRNAYGKSILDIAAENNNLKLMQFLIENKADINNRENTWSIYPYADFALKSVLLYLSTNNAFRTFSDALFLNSVYNEMFAAFSRSSGETPLHHAVFSNKTSKEALEFLIQNGADPDLTMAYYNNHNIQIIPYVITKLTLLIFNFYNPEMDRVNIVHKLILLSLMQSLIPYTLETLKPINLVDCTNANEQYINNQCIENNESNQNNDQFNLLESALYRLGYIPLDNEAKKNCEAYKYLKQYSVLNDYKSVNEFNIFNTILYKLGLISDSDIIHIQEPGAYKGGSGKDTFIIYNNAFTGQIIIKDFTTEDQIICKYCDKEDFKYRTESVLNSDSTIVSINSEIELVLLGSEASSLNFS